MHPHTAGADSRLLAATTASSATTAVAVAAAAADDDDDDDDDDDGDGGDDDDDSNGNQNDGKHSRQPGSHLQRYAQTSIETGPPQAAASPYTSGRCH